MANIHGYIESKQAYRESSGTIWLGAEGYSAIPNLTPQFPAENPQSDRKKSDLQHRASIIGKGLAPMKLDELADTTTAAAQADTTTAAAQQVIWKPPREPRYFTFSDYHEFLSSISKLKRNSPNQPPKLIVPQRDYFNQARPW